MKHVGELASISLLLKAVKTSQVRCTQGRTCLKKPTVGFFSLAFVAHKLQAHTFRIARVAKLQLNMEW